VRDSSSSVSRPTPPVRARESIRFLESAGFVQVRQKGGHKFFRHPDGRTATALDHRGEDLVRGILAKILRDTETPIEKSLNGFERLGLGGARVVWQEEHAGAPQQLRKRPIGGGDQS